MNAAPPYPLLSQLGVKSGLTYLRNAVAQYFDDYSVPAVVTPLGAKYRSFQLNQNPTTNGANRVVFIPGEYDPTSTSTKPRAYGTLSRSTRNSSTVVNPRELLSWERPFTISVWSAPVPGREALEEDSIAIVEDLLEQVVRAVQWAAQATVTWGNVVIVAPPVEQSFGAELLVSAVQIGPILDRTLEYVQTSVTVPRG
jgi:hypothetical protein